MIVRSERESLLPLSTEDLFAHLQTNKILCELCGVKPAKCLLGLSLQFCCVSDGRKCRRYPLPQGALCAYCDQPATLKLNGGSLCSKDCPGYTSLKRHLTKIERQARFSDPEYTKVFLEKRKQTNLAKYGVEHTSSLPEIKEKISTSGKVAQSRLSPEKKQRVREGSIERGNKVRVVTTDTTLCALSRDERQSIQSLSQLEQREAVIALNVLCEICKVKRGLYLLDRSFSVCCERRALECSGSPSTEDKCFGCGSQATTKTKWGFVCGSAAQDGCRLLIKDRTARQTATFNESMKGDVFRKQRKNKYEQTMMANHGVASSVELPSWKAAIKEKYGVENPAQSPVVKQRKISNCIEKHGVNHPSMLESTQDAFQVTCQERYGVDNVSQSKELEAQWRARYEEKHGVDHPMKLEINKEKYTLAMAPIRAQIWVKIQDTLRREYGNAVTNFIHIPGALERREERLQEKYGVSNVFQLEETKIKSRQTNIETYGVPYPVQNPEWFQNTWLPAMYLTHSMALPSGKVVSYQGYEHHAITHLLKSFTEDELLMNGELSFPYLDMKGNQHTYYPDLGIRSKQTAVEVKSEYTFAKSIEDGSLLLKLTAALAHGWLPVVMVFDNKGQLLETLLLDDIVETKL